LEIYKLNIDKNDRVAEALEVGSIPSLFIIHKGNVISNKVGFTDKKNLTNWIESKISK